MIENKIRKNIKNLTFSSKEVKEKSLDEIIPSTSDENFLPIT
jgi:hypothetical protein